jgi:hypothetical protein
LHTYLWAAIPGQIVNEFEEMLAVEQERAAKRRQATQNNDTADEIAESETFPEQGGEAREKAAEKVNANVSGRTLEKGKTVKDKAESDDEPEEMLAVEKERAKERKEANLKEGDESPRRGNISTSGEEGKARDKSRRESQRRRVGADAGEG